MQRLRDLTEAELLARVLPVYGGLPADPRAVPVGPGDDAAVLAAPSGSVVATTDGMVAVRDWRDEWSTGYDVGVKLAAQNLADVAAMGARPTGLLVSLVADPATPVEWAVDLARGLAATAAEAGAPVVGGDVSSAPEGVLVVTATALGDLDGRAPVLRSGARPGDVVAVCGSLGRSGAGLALLLGGAAPPGARGAGGPGEAGGAGGPGEVGGAGASGGRGGVGEADGPGGDGGPGGVGGADGPGGVGGADGPGGDGGPGGAGETGAYGGPDGAGGPGVVGGSGGAGRPRGEQASGEPGEALVRYHLAPRPPWEAGPVAARAGAHALVDVSDGLVTDVGRVARASGVVVDLDGTVLRERFAAGDIADALGPDEALRQVLAGGEEHSLVGCFPAGTDLGSLAGQAWVVIGTVGDIGTDGPRVTVDGAVPDAPGWDHFAGS